MSEATIGALLFEDIEQNEYLNELYDTILYNYGRKLFNLTDLAEEKINVEAALSFADLLSKSTHEQNGETHKLWAQEIVALLNVLYPNDETIQYYLGSVLTNISNFPGADLKANNYVGADLMERVFTQLNKAQLHVPGTEDEYFFQAQKEIYEKLNESCLSYSAPASQDKSFVTKIFIREQIKMERRCNFARIVPTKTIADEIQKDTMVDLDKLPGGRHYRIITDVGDLPLKESHNYIFIMTPERLLYMLSSNPNIKLNYVFIEEAQELTGSDGRGPFYYKIIDMLARQTPAMPHFIFSSPVISNPEVYLELISEAEEESSNALASTFAPVMQFKFLINRTNKTIQIFNDHAQDVLFIGKYKKEGLSIADLMDSVAQSDGKERHRGRNLAYFSDKKEAVGAAIEYASTKIEKEDSDLLELAEEIREQIHEDYYLAELIKKGVAYRAGYLPPAIWQQIKDLFNNGKVTAVFYAGDVAEVGNLSADNLFMADFKYEKITSAEFHNMIGSVGEIKSSLYGNVFLISDSWQTQGKDKWVQLLEDDIPVQKLSVVQDLKPKLKEHIVKGLMGGSLDIEPYRERNYEQTEEEYNMMHRFGRILLQDILSDRNSLVRKEFSAQIPPGGEEIIREKFKGQKDFADVDINVSVDQTRRLVAMIREGACYPKLPGGAASYNAVNEFLNQLCKIFDWDKYESATLGKRNHRGGHAILGWYAVILTQWMEGHRLDYILDEAIKYRAENPDRFWLEDVDTSHFDGSPEHKNVVLNDTMEVIEDVILHRISNYFLRFSNMYKSINGEHSLDNNDWYERVVRAGLCCE